MIERDEIVREDAPDEGDSVDADEEIHSLVAIPVYMHDDFEGVVVCANRPGGFEELDDEVLLSLGDHAGAVLQNHQLHGRVRSSYLAVVACSPTRSRPRTRSCAPSLGRDLGVRGAVARRLDLAPDAAERLVFAGLLRDVGKLGISDRVLLKPGPLNADERRIAQLHPLIGARIVERVPRPGRAGTRHPAPPRALGRRGLPGAARGRGDPARGPRDRGGRRLLGPDLHPPYRQPVSSELACEEIERAAGTQFDPRVARLFTEEMRRRAPEEADGGTIAETVDVPPYRPSAEPGSRCSATARSLRPIT